MFCISAGSLFPYSPKSRYIRAEGICVERPAPGTAVGKQIIRLLPDLFFLYICRTDSQLL